MKIDFKKAKYVLPLIILPFLFLFFYIFQSMGNGKGKGDQIDTTQARVKQGEINANLPGVSDAVANQDLADKFKAYQDHYKDLKDASALSGLGQDGTDPNAGLYHSAYSDQDKARMAAQKRLDSLRELIMRHKNESTGNIGASDGDDNSGDKTPEEVLHEIQIARQQYAPAEDPDRDHTDKSVKDFREKMRIIDSISNAKTEAYNSASDPRIALKKKDSGHFDPNQDPTFRPLPVSLTKPNDAHFNTVRPFTPEKSIRAIVDEDEKVYAQSRVRIRLLNDIYVGDNLIPKGTYLYAMVSGFQMHRVNLTITQIVYNDRPLPVHLDVYDQDGYLGLYVPQSNFREFSKQIGTQGTQGLSEIQMSNGDDIKANLLQQLFQTTGSSVTRYINKDKAFVKYNYVVYLIENKNNR